METKELKIIPPEGYEIDKENSTLECIKFKLKQKCLTYEDVAYNLFNGTNYYFTSDYGGVIKSCLRLYNSDRVPNNATSKKQLEKLLAINKLMNVSVFLNQGWKPNWDDLTEFKYSFSLDSNGKIYTNILVSLSNGFVFFRNEELLKEAINILGEDTIRLTLSTDY